MDFFLDIKFYKYILYLLLGLIHLFHNSFSNYYYIGLGITYIVLFLLSVHIYFYNNNEYRRKKIKKLSYIRTIQ